jgi:hypothetical protein
LNLEAWWPLSLEEDEKKLQQLKNPKKYITCKKERYCEIQKFM